MADLHLLRVFLSLLAVVALLLATVWLLRRLPGVRNFYGKHFYGKHHAHQQRLTLLHAQPLGSPRTQIALVRIDHEELLLGVTAGQITLLHKLQPAERLEIANEAHAPPAPAPNKFAALLAQLMTGRKHAP